MSSDCPWKQADIINICSFTRCMDVLFAVIILGIVNMQLRNRIASIAALAVAVGVLQIEPPKETIEFGTYNGQPLKWEVMQEYDDGSKVIVTKDCVTERFLMTRK